MLLNKKQFFINKSKWLLLLFALLLSFSMQGQESKTYVWKDIQKDVIERKETSKVKLPTKYRAVEFNMQKLRDILLEADKISLTDLLETKNRDSIAALLPTISLPMPDGEEIEFRLFSSGTLTKEYKEKNNYDLLSISGTDVKNTGRRLTITYSSSNLYMMISGMYPSVYINQYMFNYQTEENCTAVVFYTSDSPVQAEEDRNHKCSGFNEKDSKKK